MKRTYLKTVFRTVKDNFARFIAITAVVLLGVAFVTGLGALSPIYRNTVSDYFTSSGGADLVIKSVSETGFTEDEISALSDVEGVQEIQPVAVFDSASGAVKVGDYNARVYYLPMTQMKLNALKLLEGNLPSKPTEVTVDRMQNGKNSVGVGDTVEVMLFGNVQTQMTVTGIVENPLMFTRKDEPDIVNAQPLELVVYMDSAVTPLYLNVWTGSGYIQTSLPFTDVYVRAAEVQGLNIFGEIYDDKIDALVSDVKNTLGENAVCLTRHENYSLALTDSYADKITVISLIFPIFFIAVAALVVLTTMTRLVEEERPVIGCCKTLGYGNTVIALKYIVFSLICCLLGSLTGVFLGVWLLPAAIFPVFNSMFFFPETVFGLHVGMGVVSAAIMAVCITAVTAYAVLRDLKSKPAELLMPKAPKPGKKIFLEHVTFIWKRLKFRDKSTYRNIFRYMRHLIMTVVSVAGSTALVLAGFGLHDVSLNPDAEKIAGFSDTFSMISFVIILFAAALCVLVIYNLTNMNIGERKREIATLKVLGYRDIEVSGYIYREVLVMAIFGIIVGLPTGFGLLHFLFVYLEFGSVYMVEWYSYVVTAVIVLATVGVVDLLLHRKIRKIDMNDSLKTVE